MYGIAASRDCKSEDRQSAAHQHAARFFGGREGRVATKTEAGRKRKIDGPNVRNLQSLG